MNSNFQQIDPNWNNKLSDLPIYLHDSPQKNKRRNTINIYIFTFLKQKQKQDSCAGDQIVSSAETLFPACRQPRGSRLEEPLHPSRP